MQRFMIITGLVLVALGLAWPWVSKFPFGRSPGDINIVREGFQFHFPITSSVLLSLIVTILIWLFRR